VAYSKELDSFRDQLIGRPNRSKASDGTIGDAAHASRKSTTIPGLKTVRLASFTAMDITNDPARGCDAQKLVDALVNTAMHASNTSFGSAQE